MTDEREHPCPEWLLEQMRRDVERGKQSLKERQAAEQVKQAARAAIGKGNP